MDGNERDPRNPAKTGTEKNRAEAATIHHIDFDGLSHSSELDGMFKPGLRNRKVRVPAPAPSSAPQRTEKSSVNELLAREPVAPTRPLSTPGSAPHAPLPPAAVGGAQTGMIGEAAGRVRELERQLRKSEQARKKAEMRLSSAQTDSQNANKKLGQLNAETVAYRKRMQRDQQRSSEQGREEVIRALLPIIDSLERSLEPTAQVSSDQVLDGIRVVVQDLWHKLQPFGLQPFDAETQPFDPKVHEALRQVRTGAAPGTVVSCHRRGYLFNERLLRPALVEVEANDS